MARTRRGALKALLTGLLSAVLITLGGMLLLAAAAVYLHIPDTAIIILNQLLKILAIVLGVRIAVPRGGERGLATGSYIALAYTAAGFALYVLLGGGSFTVGGMLGEMLVGTAAGAVTGAIRANLAPASRIGRARHVK